MKKAGLAGVRFADIFSPAAVVLLAYARRRDDLTAFCRGKTYRPHEENAPESGLAHRRRTISL